jgi:hypothetical protein
MIEFLKNFLAGGEKQKQRDVIVLDSYAMGEDEEEQEGGCGSSSPRGGCGGCGCG